MAWIESHQELARHPKTLRLARLLGGSVPAAIGHLQLLWWWAMDFAPDGSLAAFDEFEIASAAMWDGEPTVFVEALEAAKFLDRAPSGDGYIIHDWDDYAGRLIERRRLNAERKRTSRGRPQDVTQKSGATVPDLTGPDSTVPPPPTPSPHGGRGNGAAAPRSRGERAVVVASGKLPDPPADPPPKLEAGSEWIRPGHPEYSPLVGTYKRIRV